jgi:fructose-1,6-bisphosphatase/inositol monophosphatase family enzyme
MRLWFGRGQLYNEGYKMLSNKQKDDIEELIRKVGDECILPHFRRISDDDVSYKDSNIDPVTAVDIEAEKLLKEGLLHILPGSLFVGEELYSTDKSIIQYLNDEDKPVWIVDPIDGTDNFIAGKLGFGIMACLVYKGEIVGSWLYEVSQQRMTLYYAPDFILENGKKLTSSYEPMKPFKGLIGKKLHRFPEVQNLKAECQEVILDSLQGPSIICYREMLLGHIDFLIFKVTYPWDHLPGIAFLKSQGAVISRWSGEDICLSDINEGLVVARNPEVMKVVLEKIVSILLESEEVAGMKSFKLTCPLTCSP